MPTFAQRAAAKHPSDWPGATRPGMVHYEGRRQAAENHIQEAAASQRKVTRCVRLACRVGQLARWDFYGRPAGKCCRGPLPNRQRVRSAAGSRLVFHSTRSESDDAAAGIFRFVGKARVLPPENFSPHRGSLVLRLRAGALRRLSILLFDLSRPACAGGASGPEWAKDARDQEDKTRLVANAEIGLRYLPDGNALEAFTSESGREIHPGDDMHVVWTWSGVQHTLWLNGHISNSYISTAHFRR